MLARSVCQGAVLPDTVGRVTTPQTVRGSVSAVAVKILEGAHASRQEVLLHIRVPGSPAQPRRPPSLPALGGGEDVAQREMAVLSP